MRFKTSDELFSLIENRRRNGKQLQGLKKVLETLGNPQEKLVSFHVAGTNGKGSTTSVLASVLETAGYQVGTFTSPYLEVHHDRIRVNQHCIEDEAVLRYANQYYDLWETYELSMFEIDMCIAVLYFFEKRVDYAVFEVGLGGGNDATNIIYPIASLITNIGMDHMDLLGDTLEKIATAKAGIIKEGIPLFTMEKRKECLQVFETVCHEKHSPFIVCEAPKHVRVEQSLVFEYRGLSFVQPTLASYQANNTALALSVLFYLREQGKVVITDEQMVQGVANARWAGRFELLSNDPMIIVDGAHNKEGVDALTHSCKVFPKVKFLFTALKDKPSHEMLEKLIACSGDVTVCEFDFYRAQPAENIALNYPVRVIKDYQKAIDELAKEEGVLVICGSLYFISLARKYVLEKYTK